MALGPYYDPLGEFEVHTTPYKLTVLIPPRPPLRQSLLNLIRKPSTTHHHNNHEASQQDAPTNLGYSPLNDLSDLVQKTIVLKSANFPWQMRCKHTQSKNGFKEGVKGCKEGCYVLEKGGEGVSWKCADEFCEGHVYCGSVMEDEEGRCCFGKKGEKMVCRKRDD